MQTMRGTSNHEGGIRIWSADGRTLIGKIVSLPDAYLVCAASELQQENMRLQAELEQARRERDEALTEAANIRAGFKMRVDQERQAKERAESTLAELVRLNTALQVLDEATLIERDDNWLIDRDECSHDLDDAWQAARALEKKP
jgi:hypothetical protein